MSPPSYHTRVQRVLGELAKQDKDTVVQQDLIYRVRGQFLRSGTLYGRRYRDHVLLAIQREVRARRVRVDASESPLISFTDSGKHFYKQWGTYPLYDRSHPRLKSMSIRRLQEQSQFHFRVLDEIHQTFFDFKPQTSGDIQMLPDAVQELQTNVEHLETQNTELQLELYMEESQSRVLSVFGASKGASAAGVASGSPGPAGILPGHIAPQSVGSLSASQILPRRGSPTPATYASTSENASASTSALNPVTYEEASAASSASRFEGNPSI